MNKLFYSGPSLEVLKDQYAKLHRVDHEAPLVASRETVIDAAPATVWALISNPMEWPSFDPAVSAVQIGAAVAPDVEFRRRMGRTKVRALIAVVEPEREISWVGAASGAKVVHRNLLSDAGHGRTRVVSEESMAGLFLTLVYSTAKLERVLDDWLAALKVGGERATRL